MIKIKTWYFFYNCILSKGTELLLEFQDFETKEDLKAIVQKHCPPSTHGFSEIRGDSKRVQNNRVEFWKYLYEYCIILQRKSPFYISKSDFGGFGLFLKSDVKVESMQRKFDNYLFGYLCEVKEEVYNSLNKRAYPSLYKNNEICYVLCGGLALVNHSCGSQFYFTANRTEYVYCKYKGEDSIYLKKDKELLVNYNSKFEFICICGKCTKKKQE